MTGERERAANARVMGNSNVGPGVGRCLSVEMIDVAHSWMNHETPLTWQRMVSRGIRGDRQRRNTAVTPARHDRGHGQAAGVRPSYARGAGHPIRPALVHRRAGLPEVGGRGAGRAGGRLRRGYRVRRLGHRGLRPGRRVRHAGQTGPWDLPDPPVALGVARDRADVLRHRAAGRHAGVRRPAPGAQADAREGRRPGFRLLHPPRDRVLPVPGPARGRAAAGPGRPGRLLRPHRARHRARLPPRRDHHARVDGDLGGVQPPRGRPRPAGDRPALRRRAVHRGQHHDLPARDEAGGARARACYASFMPKPFTDHPGLGHAHPPLAVRGRAQRVLRGRRAVPAVEGRPARSSPACWCTPREITAVTNQWVNSYKRLLGGGEAPAYVCWGHNNRSAMVRVPMYKPAKGQSTRVELRTPDSACNPYLAYAVILAAGLKGIEEGYELPEGAEDDVWALTDAERRALGIEPLPTNLVRGDPADGGQRAGRRDPGRARLRLLPAQQAGRVDGLPA